MTTLEKIRAEIDVSRFIDKDTKLCKNANASGLEVAMQIIDKYAEQEPCENCCNGNQIEKAKLCQKSYIAGMEHKQEPCDDVIDRAEAMTEIMMFAGNVKSDEEDVYIKVSDAVQLLRELPSVRPQEQTGHWVDINGGVECDKCGKWYPHAPIAKNEIKFCCECGARMFEPTCDTCKYNTATFMPCNACDNKSLFEPKESEDKE